MTTVATVATCNLVACFTVEQGSLKKDHLPCHCSTWGTNRVNRGLGFRSSLTPSVLVLFPMEGYQAARRTKQSGSTIKQCIAHPEQHAYTAITSPAFSERELSRSELTVLDVLRETMGTIRRPPPALRLIGCMHRPCSAVCAL